MQLMQSQFTISHVLEMDVLAADTLCQVPVKSYLSLDEQFNQEMEAYVSIVCENLPASD